MLHQVTCVHTTVVHSDNARTTKDRMLSNAMWAFNSLLQTRLATPKLLPRASGKCERDDLGRRQVIRQVMCLMIQVSRVPMLVQGVMLSCINNMMYRHIICY
jgi:hypothetical protein